MAGLPISTRKILQLSSFSLSLSLWKTYPSIPTFLGFLKMKRALIRIPDEEWDNYSFNPFRVLKPPIPLLLLLPSSPSYLDHRSFNTFQVAAPTIHFSQQSETLTETLFKPWRTMTWRRRPRFGCRQRVVDGSLLLMRTLIVKRRRSMWLGRLYRIVPRRCTALPQRLVTGIWKWRHRQ